jgi:spermidine dehydrogenase
MDPWPELAQHRRLARAIVQASVVGAILRPYAHDFMRAAERQKREGDMARRKPGDAKEEAPTRREFVGGMGSLIAATALSSASGEAVPPAAAATAKATLAPGSYPPSLQGIRGQNQAAMTSAHALRDGVAFHDGTETGESYDLVVVGAGMSGLSAAYFFRKALPHAKVLVLDGCDDFGGHARRNEFRVDGRQVLAAGGTGMIMFPNTYTPAGKELLRDIGIDSGRYYEALSKSQKDLARYPFSFATFFDRETFGVDRLVGSPLDLIYPEAVPGGSNLSIWQEFLSRSPLSEAAKQDLLRLSSDQIDHMPGLAVNEKIKRLRKMSYTDYLGTVVKIRSDALAFLQNILGGILLNVGAGPDSFSAWRAYNAHYMGFAGMKLPPIRISDIRPDSEIEPDIRLPDGNAGVARLLIRWLVPGALTGKTMEDSIAPPVDYGSLDSPKNEVRVRLNSTVVHVRHEGSPETSEQVQVTYLKDGAPRRVRAKSCVMACFNAIIPYICPEVPDAQKQALHLAVRKPIVKANVAIKNWRAVETLNARMIVSPGCFFAFTSLDLVVGLGGYRAAKKPDDPAVIMMYHAPSVPGMPARDQYRAARAKLLEYTLEDYQQKVYDQLGRMLGSGGFDPHRDISGITINRWAHGYACGGNDLYDPEWTRDEAPWVKGRRRFGRIAIANSDAAGVSLTQAAFDQAHRAVNELLQDVIQPTFYLNNPARG